MAAPGKQIHFKLSPDGKNGWLATLVVPQGPVAAASITAKGNTKASAVSRAAGLAQQVISNPIVSALLPPGAGPALKVAGKLASAVKSGAAGKYLKKLKGPGAKRLLKALF